MHAYECYLRARQEAWRWRQDAIDHAIQLLQNGLAIVGDNAGLYAALGHAYLQYREAGIDLSERPLDLAGMSERALHWLAIAVDRGFINYPFLAEHDPFFASLRNQPRFQKLMATVRDRWERFEP